MCRVSIKLRTSRRPCPLLCWYSSHHRHRASHSEKDKFRRRQLARSMETAILDTPLTLSQTLVAQAASAFLAEGLCEGFHSESRWIDR